MQFTAITARIFAEKAIIILKFVFGIRLAFLIKLVQPLWFIVDHQIGDVPSVKMAKIGIFHEIVLTNTRQLSCPFESDGIIIVYVVVPVVDSVAHKFTYDHSV